MTISADEHQIFSLYSHPAMRLPASYTSMRISERLIHSVFHWRISTVYEFHGYLALVHVHWACFDAVS